MVEIIASFFLDYPAMTGGGRGYKPIISQIIYRLSARTDEALWIGYLHADWGRGHEILGLPLGYSEILANESSEIGLVG